MPVRGEGKTPDENYDDAWEAVKAMGWALWGLCVSISEGSTAGATYNGAQFGTNLIKAATEFNEGYEKKHGSIVDRYAPKEQENESRRYIPFNGVPVFSV